MTHVSAVDIMIAAPIQRHVFTTIHDCLSSQVSIGAAEIRSEKKPLLTYTTDLQTAIVIVLYRISVTCSMRGEYLRAIHIHTNQT